MTKKNRIVLLAAAVFCLVLALMLAALHLTAVQPAAGSKNISVEVIHKDGSEKSFSYSTDEEYLGKLLLDEGLISGSDSSYGLYVEAVDGETADYSVDGSWWALSINGEFAQTGADTTPINDGDVYTWTYTIN